MTETVTKYSLEEVKKHDGSNGSKVWIVYKDNVYDVTEELDEHPAGKDIILEFAGTDATQHFNDAGHSSEAINALKRRKIGELIDEDKKANRGKKNVPDQSSEKNANHRSFLSIISCGICG